MVYTDKSEALISALNAAAVTEMSHPEDVPGWNRQADAIRQLLEGDAALADSVPHFVWHYLADFDIRRKDATYRAKQMGQLFEVISTAF